MKRTLLYIALVVTLINQVKGQALYEDFEAGILDNWQHVQGGAEVTDQVVFANDYAVKLHKPDIPPDDAQSLLLHRFHQSNYGRYLMFCRADGPVSDIQFLFQYVNSTNYYALSCNPLTTDNPQVLLYKVVNGVTSELGEVPPTFALDEWFKVAIDRTCNGEINVFINDARIISVNDLDITAKGKVALGAWGQSSYFDELSFEPFRCEIITEVDDFICSGEGYEFAGKILTESGTYDDTLKSVQNFDSIIRLNLTFVPHYLVTDFDSICHGEFYLFGPDTLTTTGRYRKTLMTQYGCDSIIDVNLVVLGGDTLQLDTTICSGSFIVFDGDTLTQPGTYDAILSSSRGCTSIVRQSLNVIELSADLGPDLYQCFDDIPSLTLTLNGDGDSEWQDGSMGSEYVVTAPGTYYATISLGNCMASDTVTVVSECEPSNSNELFIPNAFSPNGDQVNDLFKPEFIVMPGSFHMKIFDRWGSLIFETDVAQDGWDGRVNGNLVKPGVYVYIMEVDSQIKSGSITMIN